LCGFVNAVATKGQESCAPLPAVLILILGISKFAVSEKIPVTLKKKEKKYL